MSEILPALEIEVYAPGLREGDRILLLGNQMDLLPKLRYKVDAAHEIVYFEMDDPGRWSQKQIVEIFEHIGIQPRFIGSISDILPVVDGSATQRLTS